MTINLTIRRSSQAFAFLAYALLIFGWLIVMLVARNDRFAVYHAKQSLVLSLAVILAPLVWLVLGWLVAWIPSVGVVVSAAMFSLVIGLYIVAAIAWVYGMIHAARAQLRPLPFFGDWTDRLPA
jgi:uncharacterized membrane protein